MVIRTPRYIPTTVTYIFVLSPCDYIGTYYKLPYLLGVYGGRWERGHSGDSSMASVTCKRYPYIRTFVVPDFPMHPLPSNLYSEA